VCIYLVFYEVHPMNFNSYNLALVLDVVNNLAATVGIIHSFLLRLRHHIFKIAALARSAAAPPDAPPA